MDNIVIIHNIRSTYNVGAILRSVECFGLKKVIISGYSPYPRIKNDTRLPHVIEKLSKQIKKSSLGTESMLDIFYYPSPPIKQLKSEDFTIIGLEQDENSINLSDFKPPKKWALLLGEELHGITPELKNDCDYIIEISQKGSKESLNVSVAAGIALFKLTT